MSNASVTISGLAEGSKGAELEPLGMDAGAFHLPAPPPPAYHPPLKDARDYPGFRGIGSLSGSIVFCLGSCPDLKI